MKKVLFLLLLLNVCIAFGQEPVAGFQVKANRPDVKFYVSIEDTNMYAPLVVDFNNLTEEMEGDTIASYLWDFGDGTNSNQKNAEHTYDVPGTYFVYLTATTQSGSEFYSTNYITVRDTAQDGEFDFIISNCMNDFISSDYGRVKNYKFSNDSLIIYGYYLGNCGTKKTATIRYCGDTVKIRSWQTGQETTCACVYKINISIPDFGMDSVVVAFDDQILSQSFEQSVERNIKNKKIIVITNPSKDYLSLCSVDGSVLTNFKYKIYNTNGRIIKNGTLYDSLKIDIQNIESGVYIISFVDLDANMKYSTMFIKE